MDYSTSQYWSRLNNFLEANPEFVEWVHVLVSAGQPVGFGKDPAEKDWNFLKYMTFTIISQAINWGTLGIRIWERLTMYMVLKGQPTHNWSPDFMLAIPDEDYKGMMFSGAKIAAVRSLSQFIIDHRDSVANLDKMSSADIVLLFLQSRKEGKIRGIGTYTIKYYLYAAKGRDDIALHEDLCVREGMKHIYHLRERPTLKEAEALCEKWGPYASIGTNMCYAVCNWSRISNAAKK
jgi:3-methyladenine DNA glycosylase/8-oxoguanine DNA glycosylase